jgi:integrase/recombinase XerD
LLSSATAADISPLLDGKIEETSTGIPASYALHLRSVGQNNVKVIIDYIISMKSEVNLSDHYRRDLIEVLSKFSKYNDNKPFKDLTRDDVIAFLDTYRRTETPDPLHRWIGTYNVYRIHLLRFFKWLYYPNIEPGKRPKPSVVDNIAQLKRKEKSIYKPSDLWTQQDDLLFLKYCASKRDKCYHAISRDTSCRPHEIVKLKIRDIAFKTTGNYQYAEVLVNGKTGSRPIPLIDSIPYLKDYMDQDHPQPTNPNSPLICGTGRGLGRHIKAHRVYKIYDEYKKQIFPKLLDSPNVLPEDKRKIKDLLKKPWNPYIRRHSALTEKSRILKEHVLRQHAGWSGSSQMHLKYLHYFGNESTETLLEAYGIVASGQQLDQLRPKQCPNCSEPNKPDSKFCAKCRMVLTYDAYNETLKNEKDKEDDVTILKHQMQTIVATLESLDELHKKKVAEQLIQKGVYKSVDNTG